MNYYGRNLPILLLFLIIVSILTAGCIEPPDEGRMFRSSYHYTLNISTRYPVSNLTVLVPLPGKNGSPGIGSFAFNDSLLNTYSRYYLNNNQHTSTFPQAPVPTAYPPDYHLSVIDTGNGPYLKVMADTFRPEKPVQYDLSLEVDPGDFDHAVETLHPLGNESVFFPKTNLSLSLDTLFDRYSYGPGQSWVSSTPTEYRYDIPVYAEYSSLNNDGTVSITTSVNGENSWRYGYDNSGYNRYLDTFSQDFSGPARGWQIAEGTISQGDGDYNRTLFDMPIEHPGGSWKNVKTTRVFSPRYDLQALVFNDSIWVIGGIGNDTFLRKDVWRSSDGEIWDLVIERPAFSSRTGSCMLVYKDRMWLIGGKDENVGIQPGNISYKNDVWYSQNGDDWTQAIPEAAFPGRTMHQCLVFNDRMWVIGGTTQIIDSRVDLTMNGTPVPARFPERMNFSDVWSSTDGITWIPATHSAGFSPRYDHRAVVSGNQMWVFNGNDQQDAWVSSDGVAWALVSDRSSFNVMNQTWKDFSLVGFEGNLLVIGGQPVGSSYGPQITVWYSRDGKSWDIPTYSYSMNLPWERKDAAAVIFHDRVWVLGGRKPVTVTNEVWVSPADVTIEPILHP